MAPKTILSLAAKAASIQGEAHHDPVLYPMISAIHQYTPDIIPGDGVSGSLFVIKKILTDIGYKSEIFADNIHPDLKNEARPRESYLDQGENILFIHHAIAQPHHQWFLGLDDRLVMVYHNITPSHFFSAGTPHFGVTEEGRRQLALWQDKFVGIIADSEYNSEELRGLGYEGVHTIPLLIDLEKLRTIPAEEKIISRHKETFNLLNVGRIAENKCQHDLIHAFAMLGDKNCRLFFVGGVSSPDYQAYLQKLVTSYRLQGQVHFTGRVSDQTLWGYYKAANLYVCLSDHEGFGIPLIEASLAELPVVAYDSSNIRNTLADSGLLISQKNAFDVAQIWRRLIARPEWRYRLVKSQHENLKRFSSEKLTTQLKSFLASIIPKKNNL
jgi:glycosyltransferase involved in cell wall biosynthesis